MANKCVIMGKIPTTSDVEALIKRFGAPPEGAQIMYDEIEETVFCSKDSNRYHGIVSAWRKRLKRDHNIHLIATDGIKYVVATPTERMSIVSSGMKAGARKIIRMSELAVTTDASRLSDADKKARDHYCRLPSMIQAAEMTQPKELFG